jgi:hypothetical protein
VRSRARVQSSHHPLASSQVNHDQVRIELIEPEATPANKGRRTKIISFSTGTRYEQVAGHIGWLSCCAALLGVTVSTASVSGKPLVPREFDVCADIRGFVPEVFGQLKPFLKSRKPPVDHVFR